MKLKLLALVLAGVSVAGSSSAKADYIYDVSYTINSQLVTGEITLNCNTCDVTDWTLVNWSLGSLSGKTATFHGVDLTATPSRISFVPTDSASAVFGDSASAIVFGAGTVASCITMGRGEFSSCQDGVLTAAFTEPPLVIATAAAPVPGPTVGAGASSFALAAMLLGWLVRRRAPQAV